MADPLTHFADSVVKVTFSGQMFNSSEIWQTGFYVGKASGPATDPSQAWLDGVRGLWETFFKGAPAISNYYSFTEAKAARLNVNGKYANADGGIVSHPAAAVYGTGAGAPLPPQCALVATLIAGSGKGLAGKGRMYLPGIKFGLDSTGHIANADALAVANALATFFRGVYALADQPGVPINASRGHKASLGIGSRNVPINGVRVGNVYDTQRRRRGALQETYQVSGLIP